MRKTINFFLILTRLKISIVSNFWFPCAISVFSRGVKSWENGHFIGQERLYTANIDLNTYLQPYQQPFSVIDLTKIARIFHLTC